ncbi:MAG: hypothetical protein LBD17_01620 [Endomicrobium sp.]|jgi:hypothetical protein|nr:hypothetical protein [Endomicrobium sp.]
MKKIKYVSLSLVCLLLSINVFSQQQVSVIEVKKAALNSMKTKTGNTSLSELSIDTIFALKNRTNNTLLYEVVFKDGQVTLLSGSKACLPVVGYYFSPTKASALDTINESVSRDNTKAFGITRSDLEEEMFTVMGNGVTLVKKLRAEAIEVLPNARSITWFDHVFASDYKLRPLRELDVFIKEKQHLPDLPSEEEVKENGINVFEMNALLLKKVEELTLYIIDLEKRISEIENKKGGEK